jgi:glutamine synthetase
VFPDQYGRLAGLKLNAEYFLEQIDSGNNFFEYNSNPFKFDVQGSPIEFSEGLEFPDTLLLKPDLTTVKEVPWQKKEAMLFADPYSPDNKEVIPYAPRNALKSVLNKEMQCSSKMKFTMAFHKIQKDDKDSNAKEIGAENQGMLTFESNWSELIEDCRS